MADIKVESNHKNDFHPVNISLTIKYRKRMILIVFKSLFIDVVLLITGVLLTTHEQKISDPQLYYEHAIGTALYFIGLLGFITSALAAAYFSGSYFVHRHILKVSNHSLTQAHVSSTTSSSTTI
ncbi:MAG: hypothetical protein LBB39_01030 [Mycoplasmataceae bacterium]|jgi:hypothetical protein|nr:hypothetical protein [Mycoplasmataceae bacterium]